MERFACGTHNPTFEHRRGSAPMSTDSATMSPGFSAKGAVGQVLLPCRISAISSVVDQIGTSHIATPDLLICGFTLFVVIYLHKLPADSVWSRVIASLSACAIMAVILVLIFTDLNRDAVGELSTVAIALCLNLWNWNDHRAKSKVAKTVSPAT